MGLRNRTWDIMVGVVAGDVYEMRISNMRPKNVVCCFIFSQTKEKQKSPVTMATRSTQQKNQKLDPFTRQVAGRGRCT